MKIQRVLTGPFALFLGIITGYGCYGLLLFLVEEFYSDRTGPGVDWEWIINHCLYTLMLIDLFRGDWPGFWRHVGLGEALCYSLIFFWTWWFARRFRRAKKVDEADLEHHIV